jgi:hypothetical protein
MAKSKVVWGAIKPVSNFCFEFHRELTIKPNHPSSWPAYTVNLYPNPTAPLLPLYPKSPEGKTGSGTISPGSPACTTSPFGRVAHLGSASCASRVRLAFKKKGAVSFPRQTRKHHRGGTSSLGCAPPPQPRPRGAAAVRVVASLWHQLRTTPRPATLAFDYPPATTPLPILTFLIRLSV